MIEAITTRELKSITKSKDQFQLACNLLLNAHADTMGRGFGWLPMKEKFISEGIGKKGPYYLIFKPSEMIMGIMDQKSNIIDDLKIRGKTDKEVVKWLKTEFKKSNIDEFQEKLLKVYIADTKFKKSNKKAMLALTHVLHWGNTFLNKYRNSLDQAGNVRFYPDHLELVSAGKMNNKDMRIGMSLGDKAINGPYFFIDYNQNKADLPRHKNKAKEEEAKVLPFIEVVKLEALADQEKVIDEFFTTHLSKKAKVKE